MRKLSIDEFDRIKRKDIEEIRSKYGEEFAIYAVKYSIQGLREVWQCFLFRTDENNNTVLDFSKDNIERCEGFYTKQPKDGNNLLRLLLLKICLGQEYKQLALEFIKLFKIREIPGNWFAEVSYVWWEQFEPYAMRLKEFVIFLKNSNPLPILEDIEKGLMFNMYARLIGVAELSILLKPDEALLENFSFEWDLEYMKFYALGKFYYQEGKWLESFCYFEKLRIYNLRFEVKNEELIGFNNEVEEYYSDILKDVPTVEEIEELAGKSFLNIPPIEQESLRNIIDRLHIRCWNKDSKISDLNKYIDSYTQIYTMLISIMNELSHHNYEKAYQDWQDFDKSKYKLVCFDINNFTQYLSDVKDGKVKQEDSIQGVVNQVPNKDAVMIVLHMDSKIRGLIKSVLSEHYGSEEKAWSQGIPVDIRKECRCKQEEDTGQKSSCWDFFDFSDYPRIIGKNWDIFQRYFAVISDGSRSKGECLKFLNRLVYLRNPIMHSRPFDKTIEQELMIELKSYVKIIDAICSKLVNF